MHGSCCSILRSITIFVPVAGTSVVYGGRVAARAALKVVGRRCFPLSETCAAFAINPEP